MTLMDPSYLKERSDTAEAMRRLLFAGGVAVATAAGGVTEAAIEELERLLGLGSMPPELKPEAILADLPSRIESVRDHVPLLRRAQVIRDLCVIARADGHITEEEIDVIREIAGSVGVDLDVVNSTLDAACTECSNAPR